MKHIKNSVGNFVANDPDDVVTIKGALNKIGIRDTPIYNGIIEQETDSAIQEFQKKRSLKVDGVLYPKGETETALRKEVREIEVAEAS